MSKDEMSFKEKLARQRLGERLACAMLASGRDDLEGLAHHVEFLMNERVDREDLGGLEEVRDSLETIAGALEELAWPGNRG